MIRRFAIGQIDDAVDRLRAADAENVGEAVHEARKSFKRARAALRLGRDVIGKPAYARENAALRDVGRTLAPARDAAVVLETLDALRERYRDQLPPRAFIGLRAALAAEARDAEQHGADAIPAVLSDLREIRGRITAWSIDGEPLSKGYRRIYRRGRRATRAAEKHPDAETLHELRKRAKDLWHAAQILRSAGVKGKVRRRAHKLADALGDDHDLAVLADAAAQRPDTLRPDELLLLRVIVRVRQEELRDEAMRRARKLYSKKPRKAAAGLGG